MTERSGDGFSSEPPAISTGSDYSLVPVERDLTPAVIEGEPDYSSMTLDALAEAAREEHRLYQVEGAKAEAHQANALGHHIRLGEVLIAAREKVEEGGWRSWLDSVALVSRTVATDAMLLAHNKRHLPAELLQPWTDAAGRITAPGVSRALLYVRSRGLPGPYAPGGVAGRRKIAPEVQAEAKRLVKAGVTQSETAKLLGIGAVTVSRVVDPEVRKRHNANVVRRERQRRAEAAALREKQRSEERAARFASADTATQEAWSLVRKTLLAVQAAINGSAGDVVHLREAMSHLYKAEDALDASIKEARRD